MLRVIFKEFMNDDPRAFQEVWDLPVDQLTSFWWREICTHAVDLAREHDDTIDFDIVRVSSSADPIFYQLDQTTMVYGRKVAFGLATPMYIPLQPDRVDVTCWRHRDSGNEIVMERRHLYVD